jgi:hypothetical protein
MLHHSRISFIALFALALGATASAGRAAEEAGDDDPFPDTFMTMSVSYLNQAFLSIGILGDAYASDAYEDEQAGELLGAHFNMSVHVETKLKELAASKTLDDEDRRTISRLVKIAGLVRTQIETLEEIWNGDETKVKTWNELREQTAKELTAFGGPSATEQKPGAASPASGAPPAAK